MRLFDSIKQRIVWRLSKAMDAERLRRRPTPNCMMAASARLMDEAVIENFHGHKNDITIGENSFIRGRLITYGHGGRIDIGEWSYVGARSEIWSMSSITIGDRVLISHDVNIHDGTGHSNDAAARHAHFRHIISHGHPKDSKELPGLLSAPIVIEDDVWISFGVTILRGVRIGAGSIISAGSIVTKDVPPGMLYRCQVTPVLSPL
jgi:maltose O-acetyltransferase